jgi:hypothetical protein
MDNLDSICLALFFLTGLPLAGWGVARYNRVGKFEPKVNLILFLPLLSFFPCVIKSCNKGIKISHMTIAGKIIGIQKRKVTLVLVEGFSEYIPLECLTEGIDVGDSFYRPPDLGNRYFLYKKDSTGIFKEIELYSSDNRGGCTWKWMFEGK